MMPSPMSRMERINNQIAMINSPDALRSLRGYQSMRGQLPMIAREMGGVADITPEEAAVQGAQMGIEMAEQVPPEMQEQYEGDIAELQEAARGLAALGREGDTELVHMTTDELQGLMSLGELTYNPITGLPEAFKLGRIFKSITRAPRAIAKGIKNVTKSKAFKVLAPIVLGIAAPYALGASGLGLFSTANALGYGAATALGTGLGSLLAGQKPSDALKSAAFSGLTAGALKGIGGAPLTPGAERATMSGASKLYSGAGNIEAAKSLAASEAASKAATSGVTEGITRGATGDPLAKFISPGVPGGTTTPPKGILEQLGSKDFYKGIGQAMKEDLIVPKDGGGINLLGTGKKVLGKLTPTQVGETVADMSAMERQLSKEEYDAMPDEYKEMFPTYEAYTTNYFKRLQPTQYADESSALQRYVAQAKEGGPIKLAAGGEFSGMVPGEGGGMEDNVFMPIKEGREQVGTLAVSPTEYVVDSYTMAALGGGNPDEGAKLMDKTIEQIRKKAYGTTEQPKEIDGLRSLVPLTRSVA